MTNTSKPYNRGGSYICSKHENIIDLCDSVTLANAYDTIQEIRSIAEAAMIDGSNMEDGLISKREKIKDLEEAISILENRISSLE